jgi:hypothetical protein
MKKVLVFALFFILPALTHGQEEEFQTIFNKNKEKPLIRGFAGPLMQFTVIDDNFALMMGGGGGISFGNLFFGGYGIGKTNEISYKTNINHVLGFGHGGLWIGYIIRPKKSIHLSLSSQIGWGQISEKIKLPDDVYEKLYSDKITAITPIAEVEFNLSRFFKLGAGVSWTYIGGITSPYNTKDFSNPAFHLAFKFGWFN